MAASEALQYVAGFCIFNDWSARDLQFDEMSFGLGPAKGKDSASSIGPWIVTTDEMMPHIRDGRLDLKAHVRVNGDDWLRNGETVNAWYTWGEIIERAAKDSRIAPGDVIGSGTVGGGSVRESIRKGYEASRWLEPGDTVELEVENIGVLRNTLAGSAWIQGAQQPHRHPRTRDGPAWILTTPTCRTARRPLRSAAPPATTAPNRHTSAPADAPTVIASAARQSRKS